MAKQNEIAVIETSNMMIFKPEIKDSLAVMKENLGNQKLSIGDLEAIKMPTGGGQIFEVPDMTEGVRPEKTLRCIVIDQCDCKAYWPKEEKDGGDKAPVCRSNDGMMGFGDPEAPGAPGEDRMNAEHVCSKCPKNEFESHKDGKRKACKDTKRLFLMFPDKSLPTRFSLPPTSLKNYKKFITVLMGMGLAYWHIVVEISLSKEDKGGNPTAIANFKVAATLTTEERAQVQGYRMAIMPYLEAVKTEDVHSEEAAE